MIDLIARAVPARARPHPSARVAIPAIIAAAIPGGMALGAKPAADVYIVRGNGIVAARVGTVPGRMRITPWAPAAPTLNPDFAARVGLNGGWFGFAVKVGPIKVAGKSAVTRLAFGELAIKRRVVWFDRRYEAEADGAVGPGGLPADIVRFELRGPRPGERTAALPLAQSLFQPTYARIDIGGRPLTILFDPQHARTLATAGAGAAIAAAYGGTLTGGTGRAEVAFGIDRPIRTLRLARALAIGPLGIEALSVRISDNGSVSAIADADADPDEIVVSAGKKRNRRDVLIVGRDQLDRCSSIEFDKRAKLIRLTCAP